MESIGRLAGGVAHDFNNILAAIIMEVEYTLYSMSPGSSMFESLKEIEKSAHRAADLTRQLLVFSRRQIIEPKILNINDLIIKIDKMLRRLIGEDIELVTLPHDNLNKVFADPGQIEQVLTNLVVNARDAMPDGGKLTIETVNKILDEEYSKSHPDVEPGEYVMIAVSDNGTEMDKETVTHIFEPFYTTKE